MANGNVARLPELPSVSMSAAGVDANTAPAVTETELGDAVAFATAALCAAALEFHNGCLSSEARAAIGERTAAVSMMALTFGDDAVFFRQARDAGRRALRLRLDPEYFQRFSGARADKMIDMFIGDLLGVVGRVVATEREFVRRMAH